MHKNSNFEILSIQYYPLLQIPAHEKAAPRTTGHCNTLQTP